MKYITTTELRTAIPHILELLQANKTVRLIHRSKIVGSIHPEKPKKKVLTAKKLKRFKELCVKLTNGDKTTPAQRDRIYRARLEKKYGKPVL